MARHVAKASSPGTNSELSRDVYGFTVRPHHFQRYKKYAAIYKEEEAERSLRWERFLTTYCQSRPLEDAEHGIQGHDVQTKEEDGNGITSNGDGESKLEMWGKIRPSLWPVEHALVSRFKKAKRNEMATVHKSKAVSGSMLAKASSSLKRSKEHEEFYDVESPEGLHSFSKAGTDGSEDTKAACSWRDELDALVQGGVPMALRGELWQVFVGTRHRRTKGHYQALLTLLADGGGDSDGIGGLYKGASANYSLSESGILEKWTSQIEKDLPRTFPGHPALDEDGRNALRRLLTAYARHNPDVGYCQAMNFFAALLLLMMPEENAFWTLAGFIDDYFEGYYSERMLESQVDQLVLEVLVRRHFPRLVTHLDELGVQVAWVTGPWFLSVFVNILPWETVLRVWDVLLYEGNRSMLFRTALALLDQHGSKLMATKDAGDAVTVLQSSASSTFDSSQLVLIACMGYQSIDDRLLEEIRLEKRPQILAAFSERMPVEHSTRQNGRRAVLSKKYNDDTTSGAPFQVADKIIGTTGEQVALQEKSSHQALENGPSASSLDGNTYFPHTKQLGADPVDDVEEEEDTCVADLVEQVKWLKVELSRALQESREATSRADELETAFMELVKEDNRRLLSAKVEALETEVAQMRQALNDKEQEAQAMIKVVLRMEQEQRSAEDARRHAEELVADQRVAMSELQRKYEIAIASIAEMEKRTVMAETMLEATVQYQALGSGHVSVHAAPKKWNDIAAANEDLPRWSWPRLSSK